MSHVKLITDSESWARAQQFEIDVQMGMMKHGDDYNLWWCGQFENYRALWGRHFKSALEVGCGPHTNMRYILSYAKVDRLCLEDPLIQKYISYNFGGSLFRHNRNQLCKFLLQNNISVDVTSAKLEELPYRVGAFDLVVCINVLDHVQDYTRCMAEMDRVLSSGGILVLGNDLSNSEDLKNCPESYTDVGHPIKMDEQTIGESLKNYDRLYYKVLSRKEGRNPKAHYGTLLGVFQKR